MNSLFIVRLGGLLAGQQCADGSPAAWPGKWAGVAVQERAASLGNPLNTGEQVC